MAHPACGSSCVELAYTKYMQICSYNFVCTCRNQDYVAAYYSCVDSACSASDIQAWTQYAIQACNLLGVTWPSSAAAPAATAAHTSTAIVESVATLTSVSTAVVILPSTVTAADASSTTTLSNFFGAPISTSTYSLTTSSSTAGQVPISQSTSSGGLSPGAAAGIAIGAVAVVLLALIGGFFIWRRNRNQSKAPEAMSVDRGELAGGRGGNYDKEIRPTATVTSIKYPSELSDKPTIVEPIHAKVVSVPELPQHQRVVPTSFPQPVSPAPAYTEVAAVVPSEIGNATSQSIGYAAPHHNIREFESGASSGPAFASPVSELETPAFGNHHELSASPKPATSISASPHGPSSQPSHLLAPTAIASSPATREEDEELKRMKADLEELRVKKARAQELQDMEMRERELSQMIVDRELGASRDGGRAVGPW